MDYPDKSGHKRWIRAVFVLNNMDEVNEEYVVFMPTPDHK